MHDVVLVLDTLSYRICQLFISEFSES